MEARMPNQNPVEKLGLPDPTDPEEVVKGLEPEVADGPLGVPILKPRGLDAPGGSKY